MGQSSLRDRKTPFCKNGEVFHLRGELVSLVSFERQLSSETLQTDSSLLWSGKPETRHFHHLSKGNQVKIPELGTKDLFVATQLNLEKLAEVPGRVLFSF